MITPIVNNVRRRAKGKILEMNSPLARSSDLEAEFDASLAAGDADDLITTMAATLNAATPLRDRNGPLSTQQQTRRDMARKAAMSHAEATVSLDAPETVEPAQPVAPKPAKVAKPKRSPAKKPAIVEVATPPEVISVTDVTPEGYGPEVSRPMSAIEALLSAQVSPEPVYTEPLPIDQRDINDEGITLAAANDWTHTVSRVDTDAPTLEKFLAIAEKIESHRQDGTVLVSDIEALPGEDTNFKLAINKNFGDGPVYPMNDNGLHQMLGRLRLTFPAVIGDYVNAWAGLGDKAFAADLLNKHISQYLSKRDADKKWKLRIFQNNVRAALSEGYGTIANPKIIQAVRMMVQGQDLPDLKIAAGSHIGPDSMRLDMVWRAVEIADGPYGIGVSFRNNHVGQGSFEGSLLLWRGKCQNSIVIDLDESQIRVIHRGRTAEGVSLAAIPGLIEGAIEKSGAAFKAIETSIATVIEVPDWSRLFDEVLKGVKLSDKERDMAIRGSDSGLPNGLGFTAMSVVNGLTYAAHEVAGMSAARTLELERRAGALLFTPEWVEKRSKIAKEKFLASLA